MRKKKLYTITKGAELLPMGLLEEEFLRSKEGLSASTIRAYLYDLRLFKTYLGRVVVADPNAVSFCEITKGAIEGFLKERLADDSHATISRRLACIKSFCGFISNKFQCYDPATEVRFSQQRTRGFKALSLAEQASLLQAIETLPVRNWFLVLFMLHTGTRVSEVLKARLGDVSTDRRWVKVIGKGDKPRQIPIPKELRTAMLRYMDWRKKHPSRSEFPLFVSINGSKTRNPDTYRLDPKTVYRTCKQALLKAGAREEVAHPHTLRHTYAKNALRHIGAKIKNPSEALVILRDLLGHSSIQTTMIYLENDKEEISNLMEDIEA